MSQRFVFQVSLALSSLLLPGLLLAQHGAPVAVGHASMAAPVHMGALSGPQAMHVPVHVAQASHPSSHLAPAGPRQNGPRSTTHSTGYTTATRTYPARPHANDFNSYPLNDYPAPGLGFDYVHYAAVHPNSGHNHGHFRGGAIFPFFNGGIYYPSSDYVEPGAADNQSSDLVQSGSDAQPAETAETDSQMEEAPVSTVRSKPAPVPPSSEYIFVRRDGSVFFAVAYSWVNGDLQYVTKDGFRRLVSMGTLDLDATTQFNEQRGVVFHSPA
jgi:hypothetical protein